MPSAFREAVESAMEAQDAQPILDRLADDIVFSSPIVFKPYQGKETVGAVLSAVTRVFEGFEYVHELEAPDGMHALIFRAKVGDREVEGLDLVREVDGEVTELTVMVRPMSGMHALGEAMRAELEKAGLA